MRIVRIRGLAGGGGRKNLNDKYVEPGLIIIHSSQVYHEFMIYPILSALCWPVQNILYLLKKKASSEKCAGNIFVLAHLDLLLLFIY